MNIMWRYALLVVWVLGIGIQALVFSAPLQGQDLNTNVVAYGEGFSLTTMEVDQIANFLTRTGQKKPPKKQALTIALHYKLMAHDMGKDKTVNVPGDGVEAIVTGAQEFIQKALDGYPVSEEVVESYYWSNPEIYHSSETSRLNLTQEIKAEIRKKIVEKKQKQIVDEAVKNLIKKYQVTVKSAQ